MLLIAITCYRLLHDATRLLLHARLSPQPNASARQPRLSQHPYPVRLTARIADVAPVLERLQHLKLKFVLRCIGELLVCVPCKKQYSTATRARQQG